MYGHENVAGAGAVGALAMTGGHVSSLVSIGILMIAGGLFVLGALRRTRKTSE